MKTFHYKLMVIGAPSWRVLCEALPTLAFEEGMQRGFVISPDGTKNRVSGRYIYTRIGKITEVDPKTAEHRDRALEHLDDVSFEMDFQKGLVCVLGARGGLKALYEAVDTVPDCNLEYEEINLNLLELMQEVQSAYKKNAIKSLRINDYLARENMLANASFKILEVQDGERIAEKFSDQLDSFTLTLKLPDGAASLTVKRKGTVTCSEDMPDDVLSFVKDLLPRFHESEVETAEVVDPVMKATNDLRKTLRKHGATMEIETPDGKRARIV